MTAILKTLPSRFARGHIEHFLGLDGKPCWTLYFFTLGRGRPAKTKFCDAIEFGGVHNAYIGIDQLWFTHRGQIIGHFAVIAIVQNVGQLPKLTTMDGEPSEWQIKPDRWLAICNPPFHRLEEKIFHEAFRGWRYFDLEAYRGTVGAKVRI
jgi:hypothetical protein